MQLLRTELPSPLGPMRCVVGANGVCSLIWSDGWERAERRLHRRFGEIKFGELDPHHEVCRALEAYWDGDLTLIGSVSVDPGGTPFQNKVWDRLYRLRGTSHYEQVGIDIGHPKACRAVAQACATNPIVIFIGCHRVLAKGGGLGGFSSGLHRKPFLLAHEAPTFQNVLPFPPTSDTIGL